MNTFYRIDSTKVSHREILWWHPSPMVLFSWLLKWLRVPIPCSSDDAHTESTLPFVAESLPPDIADGFGPLEQELAALGFLDPVFHVIHDPGTRTTIYWATYRHESGQHFARLHQRIWHQAQKANRGRFPMFFTAFTDGTFLVSSAGKPDMATPKTVRMNRQYRAPASRLWQQHLKLVENNSGQRLIAPVRSREDLIEFTEREHVLLRDFHLARGVFRPRTTAEQAQADDFAAKVAQAQASGVENAEVLAELQKLQEHKGGWAATAPVLVISLMLFVLIGAARWSWQFTFLLIPVLLFHECGHWAAMRLFHYRNLRMFFIPLFGAAVTGRNWNVPGWKKALVSLAGPLPGIALGAGLGIASLVWHQSWLTEGALVLVFINGFNLLPVLPLDGGHVWHTILFCRNRWLDVGFRILAIGGLLLLGAAGLGRFFPFLAIMMAIALPVSFKLARITDQLRKASLPEPSPDDDQIPQATAQAIIGEVQAAFPKNSSHKQIAQHTLNVFETINAKPPGTLATLGLLAVHGGAFFLAVVIGLVITFHRMGGWGDFAQAARQQPRHAYQSSSSQQWQGAQAALDPKSPNDLLVATFKKSEPAAAEFNQLTNQLPPSSRLLLFGDSLLLTLPAREEAAREKWFTQLQLATTNLFVAASNQPVTLNFYCLAPTRRAATNLCDQLQDYLAAGPDLHLVPPWSAAVPSSDLADQAQARRFWHHLNLAVEASLNDPALNNFAKKILAADRRGALTEASRLQSEAGDMKTRLAAQAREQLRPEAPSAADEKLIDLNAALANLAFTNHVARAALDRQIAACLGAVPYVGDQPDRQAEGLGAAGGEAAHHGLILTLSWVQMNDAEAGLPALAEWLERQNCRGFKYDLAPGLSNPGEDDE
jgi:Zn-dependent protease